MRAIGRIRQDRGGETVITLQDRDLATLASLTPKQLQVLDLVLEHKSSKEIARVLGISPPTVEQRIVAARSKLGASTRGELARAYTQLRASCGDKPGNSLPYEESLYDFSQMADSLPFEQNERQAPDFNSIHTLADAGAFHIPAPWDDGPIAIKGLEALDQRFGVLGRLYAIIGLAAVLALMFLAMFAIARTLNGLI